MAAQEDEFDVLTFFIIVMAVLTAIVGFFAWVLHGKVQKQSKKIVREISNLDKLQDLAVNDKFQNWIQREREGKAEQGEAHEFNARIIASARRYRIDITRLDPKPRIPRPSVQELPFSITIKKCQLQNLVSFFYDVEEKWVGAKVKQVQLNWRKKEKSWSCEATISIFKTVTEG